VGRVLRNRFTAALERLNQIADRGSYGQTPADLQVDVHAVALATDFFQIAGILPTEIPKQIGLDLTKALEGKLELTGRPRVAEEFFSQFWFGLVLARGGVAPNVPKAQRDRATPDYLVSVDTMECAFEVKRPESVHSATGAMDRAASQIRDYGKPGFIVLDLTDALFSPDMSVAFMDEPGRLLDVVKPRLDDCATRLEGRVRNYTLSNKYSRVLGLVVLVRLHFWEKPDLSQPKGQYLLYMITFREAWTGLVVDQSEKLKRIIFAGAAEVAGGAVHKL